MPSLYRDRREGAARLARAFKGIPLSNPIVLAIPRGGVVTGSVLAREIGAELDIIVSRKLGSPGQPELAMGAVMHDGTVFMNEEVVSYMGASRGYVQEETKQQMDEARRRLRVYRGDRAYPKLRDRSVIIVDDGVATGATMITALRWVRSQGAKEVIAATPVAPLETFVRLKREADRVVCPELPEPFFAIGQFYEDFPATTDEEVVHLLRERQGESRAK
jgi:putative phosphoribosyl transferase